MIYRIVSFVCDHRRTAYAAATVALLHVAALFWHIDPRIMYGFTGLLCGVLVTEAQMVRMIYREVPKQVTAAFLLGQQRGRR